MTSLRMSARPRRLQGGSLARLGVLNERALQRLPYRLGLVDGADRRKPDVRQCRVQNNHCSVQVASGVGKRFT